MPSLVATTSALARTHNVRAHALRSPQKRKKNNAKFSGHYIHQRTHNVCAHALRSHSAHTNLSQLL